jgi:uncharacterized membrane protein (UPF0127 family)
MDMKITAGRDGCALASNAAYAGSLFARIRGLIGHSPLQDDEALVIPACKQVHTFFMRFPIDVVFTDREGRVVGIAENLSPFSFSCYYRKAYYAVELPAGAARHAGLSAGGMLLFEDGR